jgi:protein-disulfide isomerase
MGLTIGLMFVLGRIGDAVDTRSHEKAIAAHKESTRKDVEAIGPSRGPDGAPVTLVEFNDFDCSDCRDTHAMVEEVLKAYPAQVRVVFRQFPRTYLSPKAAEAALCAHEQGRFWEYHDALFARYAALEVPELKESAKKVGLDSTKFDECLDSAKMAQVVNADIEAGKKVGAILPPALFVNGLPLSFPPTPEELKGTIDAELAARASP